MGVTLDDLEPIETAPTGGGEVTLDDLEELNAPNNSVYHAPSGRVLETPQTLDARSTQFVIDRDIDGKKGFMGQVNVGEQPPPLPPDMKIPELPKPSLFARSFAGWVAGLPRVKYGSDLETAQQLKEGKRIIGQNIHPSNLMAYDTFQAPPTDEDEQMSREAGIALEESSRKLIERNRQYIKDAGFTTEDAETFGDKLSVFLGSGAPSIGVTIGMGLLTRNPLAAAGFFYAQQKGETYIEVDEARPDLSSSEKGMLASAVAIPSAALEYVGGDLLFKSMAASGLGKRIVKGLLSESTTESLQYAQEESVLNAADVRDTTQGEFLENLALTALSSGILGGASAGAIGHGAAEEAQKAGVPEDQAIKFGQSVAAAYPLASQNLQEFIDKEVSPLAADDESAAQFVTLMQRFREGKPVTEEMTFTDAEQAVFDKWVNLFQQGLPDTQSVAAVEKKFFDIATTAGLDNDQAVASAKLIGARAEAASKALGVTPMEWYDSHNLDLEVQRTREEAMQDYQARLDELNADLPEASSPEVKKQEVADDLTPEEKAARADEIAGFEQRLTAAKGATRDVSVKKPIIQYIKALGGVRTDGLIGQELRHLGINSKTAPGLFRNNESAMRDLDNIPTEEFNRALGIAAKDDGNGYVDRDWLLGKLRDEQFGERMGQERPVEDDSFIQALDKAGLDYRTATAEQVYEALGADADIVAAAADMGLELTPREVRQIRGLMEQNPQLDVQDAIDEFAERSAIMGETLYQREGDQAVLPGSEKISDKQLAERKMQGRMKSAKAQKPMDEGLFGDEAKQQTLFQRVVYNERITEMTKEVLTDMAQKSASISDPKDFVARAEMGKLTPSERARLPKDIVRTADELRDRVKDTLYQLDQAGLVVQHNIKLRGLLNADKLGGLPVPSLAIVKSGSPIGGFGEITLIGDKKLIDPAQSKKNKVFAADAYSPRYPSVRYAYNYKALQALEKALEPYAQKITQEKNDWWAVLPQPDRVEERGSEAFEESGAIAAKYLDAKGIPLPEPEKYGDKISASGTARRVVAAAREVNGYSEYAKAVADSIITGEKIFDGFTLSGNRRYLDHNLDNVVKILTRKVRDGEGFNYGVGSIRAVYTKQFKSLKNLVDHADRIVSSEDFVAIKDKVDKEFIALSDKWREHSPLKNEFGFLDAFSEHLKEGASKGLGYVNREYYKGAVPEEVLNETAAFLDSLKNMPTEYFEAKIQRAVQLQEFEAAVVPEGAQYEEAVALLKKRGLEVERYKAGDEVSRRQAIGKFQRLFFQEGARGAITFGKNRTLIQLFQDANPSTLLHELGHLFLRDMRNVAAGSRRPQVKKDFETIKQWLGSKDGKFTEDQEEKFARGFESYLREGKAPKEGLQAVFDRFKQWLTRVYKGAKDLNVEINDDVRAVFDRMLGGDYKQAEAAVKSKEAAQLEADYARVAQAPPSTLGQDSGDVLASAKNLAGNIFTPISSRLGRIDPKLKAAVRKYTFQTGLNEQRDRERAMPFLNALEKMEDADYRMLDFALKNRDTARADELLKKYDMTAQFQEIRDLLDDIYNKAIAAGLDVSYLDDYFPRMVQLNRSSDYLSALRGRPDWSLIQEAIQLEDPMNQWTDEEKAVFVNKWLRGHASAATYLTKPSFIKERVIDYVEPQYNSYYLESGEALLKYISGMRLGIAQQEIFGMVNKETAEANRKAAKTASEIGRIKLMDSIDLVTELQARAKKRSLEQDDIFADIEDPYTINGKDSAQVKKELLEKLDKKLADYRALGSKPGSMDDSIGAYVLNLVNQGVIDHNQENEVKMLMQALVNSKGPSVFVSWMKNVGYVYLMGSPISAITQIGDLAFALAKNGYYNTGVSVMKAITGRSILTKEALGIDNIAQEFEDNTRASTAVRKVFKAVGLTFMDNVGKQTFIESSYKRLRAEAKKNSTSWHNYMQNIFGDEVAQVRQDLLDGNLTDNVKLLLYSELSDVQPVSLAEMPVGYLRGGNLRAFYMLKTYTVKQIDVYRTQIFDQMASGDPAEVKAGTAMLFRLSIALMLTGMGADAIKDLLLGRAMTLSETVIDNLWKLTGLTKYNIYQAREEGIGDTIIQMLFSFAAVAAPLKDIGNDVDEILIGKTSKRTGETTRKPAKDSETLGKVPVVGKFYYWWYGGGRAKEERKAAKNAQ